jgi:tetratricopeptide (TPR) repeat protein
MEREGVVEVGTLKFGRLVLRAFSLLAFTGAGLGFLCARADGKDARWIRMQSANFEMYSSAGEKSTRETLAYFEQVRGIFAQAMVKAVEKPLPVRIVAFGSRKEYERYRINDFASAYYQGTAERDYIVLSETGAESFPTAVHEYFHLFARHAQLNLPPIPGRLRALRQEPWVPLADILSADRSSPYYNEKEKAGSLYNEGWALTHMLSLSPEYLPKFSEFLGAIQSGTPSEEALTKVYGKSLARIEQDLEIYLRGRIFTGLLFPVKVEKAAGEMAAEAVTPFGVKLMLADLTDRPGNEEATRKTLDGLAQDAPQRPEPYARLGYLALRRGQREEAQKQFERAFDLGSREPRMLWDYGRMIEVSNGAEAIRIFGELVKQQPGRVDPRLELAAAQFRAGRARDAIETMAAIGKVPDEDAPRFFTILAAAQWDSGNREEALKAAIALASVAKTHEERAEADRYLKLLGNSSARPAAAMAPPRMPAQARAPGHEPRAPTDPSTLERVSLAGSVIRLDCEGMAAKLWLETPGGKKVFLVEDPNNIKVSEHSAETVDLACGPQKPAAVRIEYSRPASGQSEIDGVLRLIQFEP